MIIDFSRERTIVKCDSLLKYFYWALRRTPGLGKKTRKLCSLMLGSRMGMDGIDIRTKSILLEHSFSWACYAPDGNRLQFFDADRRCVTKLAMSLDASAIQREVQMRSRMDSACPDILEWSATCGIIVEPMLVLRALNYDLKYLDEAIALLEKGLYRRELVAVHDNLNQLVESVDLARIRLAIARCGINEVELSEVHGDLWYGNLCRDEQGALLLLDWEYARICVVSHDVWTYLFQRQRELAAPFDESFMEEFSVSIERCLKMKCEPAMARGYHLIHLLERRSLFCGLVLVHKDEEILYLSQEIENTLELIG